MTERERITKPLGLITRPALYGAIPIGGMSTCENLVMRAPALLENAPAAVQVNTVGAANDVIHGLQGILGGRIISIARTGAGVWTERTDTTAASATTYPSSRTYSQTGRLCFMRARNRVYANQETARPVVFDTDNPSGLPQTVRSCGLPQAHITRITTTTTNAQALVQNNVVGYAALYKRRFSDGYEVISRPSPIWQFFSSGAAAVNVNVFVALTPGTGMLQAGDIIELYRTDIISGGSITTDPGTTCKLIKSYVLTSGDVAGPTEIIILDNTIPGPLGVTSGRELYTNPNQLGLLGGNRVPEIARCNAYFKDYAFIGNIHQRAQLEFSVPGGIGSTTDTGLNTAGFRANGIGQRRVSGTTAIGSPTITGVAAADFVGLAVGMSLLTLSPFPGGSTIQSLNSGAGTITMTANATAVIAPGNLDFMDVIEFNITGYGTVSVRYAVLGGTATSPQGLLASLCSTTTPVAFEISASEALLGGQNATNGLKVITWVLEPIIPDTNTTYTVRATNGANYSPNLPEITATAQTLTYTNYKNLLRWSKNAQPEHWPIASPINETFVGGGEIIQLVPTRDALWVFCTDGLFRLSGAGGQWRVDPVDTTLILASPRGACALQDEVFAYSNRGFMRVSDAGISNLSENVISDLLPGAEYTETASILVDANQQDDEIVVRVGSTQVFVFSTRFGVWSTALFTDVTAMAYWRYPASGAACLAYASNPAGLAPRYFRWNDTANFQAPRAVFQPIYSKDPFSARQWDNMVLAFNLAAAGQNVTPIWNGVNGVAQALKGAGRYVQEARALCGVPRAAALGNTISVGWFSAATVVQQRFFGLAVHSDNETDQHVKR